MLDEIEVVERIDSKKPWDIVPGDLDLQPEALAEAAKKVRRHVRLPQANWLTRTRKKLGSER